jgi:predicted ATP-binding protein involved in virulence
MILKTLQLSNFRCFTSLAVEFDEKLTVLIAENGNGKTTILDAAAIALDEIVRYHAGGRANSPGRAILDRADVRLGKDAATIAAAIKGDQDFLLEWSDSVEIDGPDKVRHSSGKRPDELKQYLDRQWRGESLDDAPLVIFYQANRAFRQAVDSKFLLRSFEPKHAFDNALDASAGFETIQHWFYQIESEEAREKAKRRDFNYEDTRLKAVRDAVTTMIPEVDGIGFEAGMVGLTIFWNLPFTDPNDPLAGLPGLLFLNQLSDGYRSLLAMVMDLAVRLVIANPEREDPLNAQCVVMVDEIDLHLHPRLQQRIIGDLTRTFPGVQWILTTHSPQVLSTVKPESIRILRAGQMILGEGLHSFGVQSNRILNEIMGVAARPEIPELEDKKQILMDEIRNPAEGSATSSPVMDELVDILGSEDPFIVNAKAEIIRLTRKKP